MHEPDRDSSGATVRAPVPVVPETPPRTQRAGVSELGLLNSGSSNPPFAIWFGPNDAMVRCWVVTAEGEMAGVVTEPSAKLAALMNVAEVLTVSCDVAVLTTAGFYSFLYS